MEKTDFLKYVDHTLLKPTATWDDIQALCNEALQYHTASVCIPPCYVLRVKEKYGQGINICTVIGFPLGYNTTSAKITEAEQALSDGANEIDMVVNISDVKNGDYEKVQNEIAAIKKVVGSKVLKVIIETCYLTDKEKIAMCKAVTTAKSDFIKTSTGFGTDGAKIEDIRLFKKHIGPGVQIKAAGGVKSIEDLAMFIGEGCTRIGTSSAVQLISGHSAEGY